MKIVFVSEFANAASNSTGLFVRQICQIAESEGFHVHTVSCDRGGGNLTSTQSIVGLPLARVLKRIRPVYWWVLSVRLGMKAYTQSSKGDVIVVGSNPLFLPLIMSLFGIIYRRRSKVLLLFDVFPLNAIAAKKLKPDGWIAATLVWLFGRACAAFDAIIINGRDCIDVINRLKTKAECRVIYIPHFLFEEYCPAGMRKTGASANTTQLRLQYLGNAGPMQGLDHYAPLLINLISSFADLQLSIFGNAATSISIGLQAETVSQRIKKFPEVEFKDRNLALGEGEYGLVTLAPGMYGLAVPSKAWFALAAGQGLIVFGDAGSELDLVLSENPSLGVFVASDRLDEAVPKIMGFVAQDQLSWETRKKMGAAFLQKCQEEALKSYTALFNDLTSMRLSKDSR